MARIGSPVSWMVIESEGVVDTPDGGKALHLEVRLRWWRWFAPSFWWAVLRGPRS